MKFAEEELVRLFVYGTLRRKGVANHFLEEYKVIEEDVWIAGFVMYDAGWYPFAVPADKNSKIVGDICQIPGWKIAELDKYEGPDYKMVHLEDFNASLYVKKDNAVTGFKRVPEGDWLKYWEEKNG